MLSITPRKRLVAAAALLLSLLLQTGPVAAQDINVTVTDVSVSLKDNGDSNNGERYTLGKLKKVEITCRAVSIRPLRDSDFFWRTERSNSSATLDSRITMKTTVTADGTIGTSVLSINYPIKSDITSYVCVVNQTVSSTGRFLSAPLLTVKVNGVNEYDAAVWPGDSVTIVCLVEGGYPVGDIRWTKSTDPSFNVTNNNTIYLRSASYEADRGYITCASRNIYGENTAKLFLRVKNPLSFLAPLVAFICEIVVMLCVILVYEMYDKKRRRVSDGDNVKSE